jgi:TolB-like 6-blade propeller-like
MVSCRTAVSRHSRIARRVTKLLAIAAISGCARTADEREEVRGRTSEAVVALRGQALTDTLALALPNGVFATEDAVIVQDTRGDAVQAFDTSGTPIASTGREGSGPGEFVDPWDVFGRPGHPGEFWIFDSRLGRLTPYTVSSLRSSPEHPRPARDAMTLSKGLVLESPRWLDDSTVVAINSMIEEGERRFALFGADGRLRRTVGEPPPGSGPAFIRQQAYGGPMAVHPTRPLFVLGGRFAGRLEVYDANGELRVQMEVPERFEPDFKPARDGLNMVYGPEMRHGYVDVVARGDHVYGLFSGALFHDDGSQYGREIHVFDWDGRLLRRLQLDQGALRIAINPSATRLYALREEPHPVLVSYHLPAARLAAAEGR